jgi:hypothetical protein
VFTAETVAGAELVIDKPVGSGYQLITYHSRTIARGKTRPNEFETRFFQHSQDTQQSSDPDKFFFREKGSSDEALRVSSLARVDEYSRSQL